MTENTVLQIIRQLLTDGVHTVCYTLVDASFHPL